MHDHNLIGGQWTGEQYESNISLSNADDVMDYYASGSKQETNQAIESASQAKTSWRAFPFGQQAPLLRKMGDAILAAKDDLGQALSRRDGKIPAEGIGEESRVGNTFLYYAAQIENGHGDVFTASRPNTIIQSIRKSVGTIGIIT